MDIIDQVLNTTEGIQNINRGLITHYHDIDKYHHITIFLTVFRKFIKPLDLLRILITKYCYCHIIIKYTQLIIFVFLRFEFDLINQGQQYYSNRTTAKFILPTLRQERYFVTKKNTF